MDQSKAAPPGPDVDAGPSEDEVSEFLDRLDLLNAAPPAAGQSADTNLIGILQEVQEHFGYLPAVALEHISRRLRIPLSRIYGVVSFYAQFYTSPRGRHTILACRGTACHVRGAGHVLDTIRRVLGIDEGQTTPDMLFYLETVACLGTCFLAPVMMIDNQYFGKLTPQGVASILKSYQAKES